VCARQRRPTGFAGSGQTFFNITYIPGARGWGGGLALSGLVRFSFLVVVVVVVVVYLA
jgi:hypothetical protein